MEGIGKNTHIKRQRKGILLIGIVAVLLIPNAAIEFREAYRDISSMTS